MNDLTGIGRAELLDMIRRLLDENKVLNENLTAVQSRCTELLDEVRALRRNTETSDVG